MRTRRPSALRGNYASPLQRRIYQVYAVLAAADPQHKTCRLKYEYAFLHPVPRASTPTEGGKWWVSVLARHATPDPDCPVETWPGTTRSVKGSIPPVSLSLAASNALENKRPRVRFQATWTASSAALAAQGAKPTPADVVSRPPPTRSPARQARQHAGTTAVDVARGRSPLVVELGKVRAEGRVLASGWPSSHAARRRSAPEYARRGVVGLGDPDLQADAGLDAGIAPDHADAIVDCRAPRGADAPSAPGRTRYRHAVTAVSSLYSDSCVGWTYSTSRVNTRASRVPRATVRIRNCAMGLSGKFL